MSKQIAVRLPEDLVGYLDELVARGSATSRASAVTGALIEQRRRERAERDVAILAEAAHDDDFDELAEHVACTPMDDFA
jgi:Arc/MetJ-type ribon-helix-helix transcriptional regulator